MMRRTSFTYPGNCASTVNSFKNLKNVLNKRKVNFKILPCTNDIWAVDYMPIQKAIDKFIQFTYEPDYLQNAKFIATQTNPENVCKAIDVDTFKGEIKLDGGNLIRGKQWTILTYKVFKEKSHIRRHKLINELG